MFSEVVFFRSTQGCNRIPHFIFHNIELVFSFKPYLLTAQVSRDLPLVRLLFHHHLMGKNRFPFTFTILAAVLLLVILILVLQRIQN